MAGWVVSRSFVSGVVSAHLRWFDGAVAGLGVVPQAVLHSDEGEINLAAAAVDDRGCGEGDAGGGADLSPVPARRAFRLAVLPSRPLQEVPGQRVVRSLDGDFGSSGHAIGAAAAVVRGYRGGGVGCAVSGDGRRGPVRTGGGEVEPQRVARSLECDVRLTVGTDHDRGRRVVDGAGEVRRAPTGTGGGVPVPHRMVRALGDNVRLTAGPHVDRRRRVSGAGAGDHRRAPGATGGGVEVQQRILWAFGDNVRLTVGPDEDR